MGNGNQPPAGPIARCTALGAFCGIVAAVLSVVIAYSTGTDEKNGLLLPISQMFFLIVILLPLGSLAGAIVGLLLRHRGHRDGTQ